MPILKVFGRQSLGFHVQAAGFTSVGISAHGGARFGNGAKQVTMELLMEVMGYHIYVV